jgi:hypothetical protein
MSNCYKKFKVQGSKFKVYSVPKISGVEPPPRRFLKRAVEGACSTYILVPKLRWGTLLPAKLCLASKPAAESGGRCPPYAAFQALRVGLRTMRSCPFLPEFCRKPIEYYVLSQRLRAGRPGLPGRRGPAGAVRRARARTNLC